MEQTSKSENPATRFINKWHRETISQNKVLKRANGQATTVAAVGIPYEGSIYLVPAYLRDGKVLTEDEVYNHWITKLPKLIQDGEITGIEDNYQGPIEKHPANVIAEENHIFMDQENIPDSAFSFFEEENG
tara:strand:+ start:92 stop:484 length:393 start_codon:yes stop_codon:yes gene_type:complete